LAIPWARMGPGDATRRGCFWLFGFLAFWLFWAETLLIRGLRGFLPGESLLYLINRNKVDADAMLGRR
jgi:hypothetical protein